MNAKHKFNGEEETKTPTIISQPNPCSIVEHGGESAIHGIITENDELPPAKLSEDREMGMLPESVDAHGSDVSSARDKGC